MKVYELMSALSEMPGGAEVRASALMSLAEFAGEGPTHNIEGVEYYSVNNTIKEAEIDTEDNVVLYL